MRLLLRPSDVVNEIEDRFVTVIDSKSLLNGYHSN
jgi:hypothetical protein